MFVTSLKVPVRSDAAIGCNLRISTLQKSQLIRRVRPFKLLCTSSTAQTTLNAPYMEDAYNALVERAITNSNASSRDIRYLIGVSGPPGGGKSTLARDVCHLINLKVGSDIAVNVPMDGFHYYKRELDQMSDPPALYARRGAHWTFDAEKFVVCLKSIKYEASKTLYAPSFDHGAGDPKADAIKVLPQHKIVVIEGNYVLLDVEPWNQLWQDEDGEQPKILDDTWYVDCELKVAMKRVFQRQTGNGVAADVSRGRIEGNDRPNGELIQGTKKRAAVVVPSLPFKRTFKR